MLSSAPVHEESHHNLVGPVSQSKTKSDDDVEDVDERMPAFVRSLCEGRDMAW